ncbi:hypothetical protein FH972_012745 [Carpinus fangiana]|uniref:Uncharacterized protein n=1 Tax=Carpinus fangiana TaxID=176857 RepID=A0A5N6R839_9ROSI|nr:hypothetical protein FH972_012745 [Carpinus fangiana]
MESRRKKGTHAKRLQDEARDSLTRKTVVIRAKKKEVIPKLFKDVEETIVLETSITSSLRASTLEGCISQHNKVIIGERNDHQKEDSNSKLLFKQQERANRAPSGNENMVSFIPKEVQVAMNIKGVVLMKRNVRSLLGSAQHNSEETVDDDVKENDDAEDNIVVMDYAQPHRKPPIHNEKH